MLTHDELVQVAEDMYTGETTYNEWRLTMQDHGWPSTPRDYALEMVMFWGDPGLGEEQVALDADERDIVINLIEAKAAQEVT